MNQDIERRKALYKRFQKEFPLESLKDMPIEKYTNLNKKDSFCYWLESETYELGSIWGGSSYKYGIYKYKKKPNQADKWVQSDDEYAWYKKYGKTTAKDAYTYVRDAIVKIADCARKGNYETIESIDILGNTIKWKIAFLYSNEHLIPIFNRNMLEKLANHFGMKNVEEHGISDIQHFLFSKKGSKDLYEFYDELLVLLESLNIPNNITQAPEIVNDDNKTEDKVNYWWLCANPKIWSITEWPIGEEQNYTMYNADGNKRRIFQNFLEAKHGDKVICYETNPTKKVVGLAIISKENDGQHIWLKKTATLTSPIDLSVIKSMPELMGMEFFVNSNGSLFRLTKDEYTTLINLIYKRNEDSSKFKSYDEYTDKDFLDEVFVSEEELDTLKYLVENKKNVILQGVPGVGKTFCARRLAWAMNGKKDDEHIAFIQFHQNYSYEDFVMGYKPAGGTFALQTGVFYKFCIKAANHPNERFFFIIDEINRGNLSKIFGELLMLIEKDYRGEKLTLAYRDEKFSVPQNLYIIGMMNTADRSLALIDYALRRRFSFFNMHPGFDSNGFKAYQKSKGNTKFDTLINIIKDLNNYIASDDSLGEGFEIGHSYFYTEGEISDQWLKSVIKFDIIPLLQEYWFDNKLMVKQWTERLNAVLK